MQKGFKTKALTVLGAALLSGSVFAAGPTLSDIPSVIITDKMTADEVDANPTTPFDYLATATQNIYRFTDAIDLRPYVNFAGDLDTVNYMFTESDPETEVLRTGTDQTIQINGEFGAESIPDYATVMGSGNDLPAAGDALDFRNDAANPTDEFLAAPAITLPAEALMSMFVASDDTVGDQPVAAEVNSASFFVITTNEEEFASDGLSELTGIVEACVTAYDDFEGWNGVAQTSIFLFSQTPPGTIAGTNDATLTPATSPAPSSASLGIATAANNGGSLGVSPQMAWWESANPAADEGFATTAGNIYVARYSVSTASADATALPTVRFRVGQNSLSGAGVASTEILETSPNHITSSTTEPFRAYYYAHADDTAMVTMDALDLSPTYSIDITLNYVDVLTFNRESLQNGVVAFNQGSSAVTVASGQLGPPAGETGFDTALWDTTNGGNLLNITTTEATDKLTFTGNGNGQGRWNHLTWETKTNNAPASAVEDVAAGKLVVLDAWLSAATAKTNYPGVRLMLSSPVNSTEMDDLQQLASYFEFNGGTDAGNLLSLESASKRYTAILESQLLDENAVMDVQVLIYALFYDVSVSGSNFVNNASGTINVDRVVVTTYDAPSDVATFAGTCP